MNTRAPRRHDDLTTIWRFLAQDLLVECPKCGGRASVHRSAAFVSGPVWAAPRRLTCLNCGHASKVARRTSAYSWSGLKQRDPFHRALLWLREDTRHGEVWAYNAQHLGFLKSYVAATHRTSTRDRQWGWRNSTLASRLPKWMVTAKHRDGTLKAIRRLEKRLCERS